MVSKLLRRSGIAAVHISRLLGWSPKMVYQAGIGLHWQEIDCFKECWPDLRFVGCEPHPHLYSSLKKSGKYPGEIHPVALGDHVKTATLYYRQRHRDGSSLNHLYDKENVTTKQVEVEVNTLDNLFGATVGDVKPILLWLDCEGSELDVIKGGKEFIKHVDMINVEMTGKPPADGWCKPWDVHRALIDYGFVLQYIHTFRSHQGQYDAVYVRPQMFRLEYSCSPCRCKDCGG